MRPDPAFHRWERIALVSVALLVPLGAYIGLSIWQNWKIKQERRDRWARAEARFKELCKTAGAVIHRTVKDVEGIELTKLRPELKPGDPRYFDPMFEGAAMAGEAQGSRYVLQFLTSEYRNVHRPEERGGFMSFGTPVGHNQLPPIYGYRYVEYTDAATGKLYRCRAVPDKSPSGTFDDRMPCEVIQRGAARFAFDYEDLVDSTDRQLWIAGTVLKVIDKHSGEILATYTKFVWDQGFGTTGTGREPWRHADGMGPSRNCPSTPRQLTGHDSRYFVDTVLIPKQGD